MSTKLNLFFARTQTPSEWSFIAARNGLAKTFSNFAELRARLYSLAF